MNLFRVGYLLGATVLLAGGSVHAQLSLGSLNLIVQNDLNLGGGNTHIHSGALAGSLTFSGGVKEFGMDASGANQITALYVANAYNRTGGTLDLHGQKYFGPALPTTATPNVAQNLGTKLASDPLAPDTIGSLFGSFAATSTSFNGLANTGTFGINGNTLSISTGASALSAVDITIAQLQAFFSSSGANAQIGYTGVNTSHRLVINVLGTAGADSLNFYSKFLGVGANEYSNVLWNFVGIESIIVAGDKFAGSLLGTDSAITWNAQDLDGQLIAKSLAVTGSQEFHNFYFFTDNLPIPEPSTYGAIGAAALVAMIGLRRSRRSRKA